MGIINSLFGTAPTPAPASTSTPAQVSTSAKATPVNSAPTQPGNIPEGTATPATPTPGTEVNGVVPETALDAPVDTTIDTTVKQKTSDSPLDQFSKLWEPVITPEGQVKAPEQLDPVKLQEIISKADFTKSLTPENLARITAGGDEAQAAFTESLNSVAQQVLMQATMAANKMTEQAIKTALEAQAANLPNLIRAQTTSNNLQKANPVFSNPAVKPVIEAVQAQLAAKNPDATADQLTEMAQNFVAVMGEAFAPKSDETSNPNKSVVKDIDWDSFLKGQ